MGTGLCIQWDWAKSLVLGLGSWETGKLILAVCLKIFWNAGVELEPPHTGSSRGAARPVWQLPGVRHVWFLGLPGLGLSPRPLSHRLLPASFRGTVNPLNGLGGNSSSPLLNGSSDAACRALEVAELRPYSGPNHPPTPSQNNNNPSDILAAGGTEAAFVPGPSGDPPSVQQQCPFVRPARCTGTARGRFCECLFSLRKLEGVEGGRRKPAGRFVFTSSTWRHLVFAPRPGARTMSACAAPESGARGGGWRDPGENADSYSLEEPGGETGSGFVLVFGRAQ